MIALRMARIETVEIPVVGGIVSEDAFPCPLPEMWIEKVEFSGAETVRFYANVSWGFEPTEEGVLGGEAPYYWGLQMLSVGGAALPPMWHVGVDDPSGVVGAREGGFLLDGFPCTATLGEIASGEAPFGNSEVCAPESDSAVLEWALAAGPAPTPGAPHCNTSTYSALLADPFAWINAPWNANTNSSADGGVVISQFRSYAVTLVPPSAVGTVFAKDRTVRITYTFEQPSSPPPPTGTPPFPPFRGDSPSKSRVYLHLLL